MTYLMDYQVRDARADEVFTTVPRRHSVIRERWDSLRQRVGEFAVQLVEVPEVEVASWRLPADATTAGKARRLTRECLADWDSEDLSDVAELLVSELVTNVLCHTCCADLTLRLSAAEGMLRCEVEDCDGRLPSTSRPEARDEDESGRGLHLLDMLACCWGAQRTRDGKVIWFELSSAR